MAADRLDANGQPYRSTKKFAQALGACAQSACPAAIAVVSAASPEGRLEKRAVRARARELADALSEAHPASGVLVITTAAGEAAVMALAPATSPDEFAEEIAAIAPDAATMAVGRAPRVPAPAAALPAFGRAIDARARAGARRLDAGALEAMLDRATIAAELRKAHRGDDLSLAYQPIVELETGRVRALELTLRWRSPSRGPIAPEQFLPIAEEEKLDEALNKWSVRNAFVELSPLLRERPDIAVAAKVAAVRFDAGAANRLLDEIAEVGGDPSQAIFELRESRAIEDDDAVAAGIAAAHARGARVVLDDFGFGFHAIAFMGDQRVDGVKIDRSFLGDPQGAGPGGAMEAALAASRALALEAIVKGVDSESDLIFARRMEVRFAQGRRFAPPQAAAALGASVVQIEMTGVAGASSSMRGDDDFSADDALALSGVARWRYSPQIGALWLVSEGLSALRDHGERGSDLMAAIPAESRNMLRARLDRALSRGRAGTFEIVTNEVGEDGLPIWLFFRSAPPAAGASALFGVVEDVSQIARMRRQVENAAQAERILDSLPEAVALEDPRGRMVYANRMARETIGRRGGGHSADQSGGALAEAFGFANAQMARTEAETVLELGERRDVARLLADGGDGEWRLVHLAPALDDARRPIGVVTVLRDAPVIAALAAEENRDASTRAANALMERLLDTLDEPLFAKDAAGRFLLANKAAARALGVAGVEQLIGRTDFDVLPAEIAQSLWNDERQAMAVGGRCVFGQSLTDFDGRTRWCSAVLTPMLDASGQPIGVVGHRRDLTTIEGIDLDLSKSAAQNDLFRAMLDVLPDMVFCKDKQGRFLAANRAMANSLGASSAEAIVGKTEHDLIEPEIAAALSADEAAFMARGETTLLDQPYKRADGSRGWICSLKAPMRDDEGRLIGYVGHGRDVTELREARGELERTIELFTETMESLEEGLALYNKDGSIILMNTSFAKTLGSTSDKMTGRTIEDVARIIAPSNSEGGAGRERWVQERIKRWRAANGEQVDQKIGARHYLTRDVRTHSGHVVTLRTDITAMKQAENNLRRLAITDGLTGAFNRRYFVEQATKRLLRRAHAHGSSGVLLIDVDHFKQINDRFGHAAGDEALVRLTEIVRSTLRPEELFARWGGEEFAVFLDDVDQKEAFAAADRLRRKIARATENRRPSVTVSVGVALAYGDELERALRRADAALYAAKADGRNCVRIAPSDQLAH